MKKNKNTLLVSFIKCTSHFAFWLVLSQIIDILNLKIAADIIIGTVACLIATFKNKNKHLGFAYCFCDCVSTLLQCSFASALSYYTWLYDCNLPAKIYIFSVIALMKQLLSDVFQKEKFAIKDKFFYACVILTITLTCLISGDVEKATNDLINVISIQRPEIHELSTCSFMYISPLETAVTTIIKLFPYATITFVLGLFIQNKDIKYLGTPCCKKDYKNKLKDTFLGTI